MKDCQLENCARVEDECHTRASRDFLVDESGCLIFQKDLLPKLLLLSELDLTDCNILEFPDALGSIHGLRIFLASHNRLSILPSTFGLLRELRKVVLSYNKLTELPCSFSDLNALEFLDVSHNNLVVPPSCFEFGCVKISSLDISYNCLEEWKVGPLCAHGLKFLNCGHNILHTNPPWIWGDFCRSLESLDLSFNKFKDPAYMVRPYTLWRTGVTLRLKKLNLSNCGFTSNHIHLLHQLKALQWLMLSNAGSNLALEYERTKGGGSLSNFLWDISFQGIQSAMILTELHLERVGLTALADDISSLELLEVLNCSYNNLQWLPDAITKLGKLRVAKFSENKLLYLPEDFGDLVSLEELWLDQNQLSELPPSCANLKVLKWLDLYSNNIEIFPSCLEMLSSSLVGLDLEYNFINLRHNAISFPCSLEKLRDAISKHSAVVKPRYRGQRPPSEILDSGSSEDSESDCETVSSQEELREVEEESLRDEENWDLDGGEDDYFDPTCMSVQKQVLCPARVLIINELVLRPDSFCPSDIHPSPSIRANKQIPFIPDEGQFEDV